MIRGGHIDLAVLAAWSDLRGRSGQLVGARQADHRHGWRHGSGGGAKRIIVLQTHTAKDGTPKLVKTLTLPVTALGCVNR